VVITRFQREKKRRARKRWGGNNSKAEIAFDCVIDISRKREWEGGALLFSRLPHNKRGRERQDKKGGNREGKTEDTNTKGA